MDKKLRQILENIGKVMVGQKKTSTLLLCALLAGGHVLLEDRALHELYERAR